MKEKELAQEIASVKSTVNQVKDAEGVTFKSKAEFDAAVAASINKFVEQKQQSDIDQKYAQFEGLPKRLRMASTSMGTLVPDSRWWSFLIWSVRTASNFMTHQNRLWMPVKGM